MVFHICLKCGYAYDQRVGDVDSDVKPDTPFEMLPENWTCPLCGAHKNDFVEQR